MKKVILILFLFLILLPGCISKPDAYPFPNRNIPIQSIDLLHNRNPGGIGTDEDNMDLLLSLGQSEFHNFMDALYSLPTRRCGTPPPYGYGEYIAKVTYENGDVEMYGSLNIVHIPMGETSYGVGDYIFADDSFDSLVSEYVDISALPEPPGL